MGREIASVRPAALRRSTVQSLDAYLSFRHRFRNLYLFDLDPTPIRVLLDEATDVWSAAGGDLARLATTLEGMAESLRPR